MQMEKRPDSTPLQSDRARDGGWSLPSQGFNPSGCTRDRLHLTSKEDPYCSAGSVSLSFPGLAVQVRPSERPAPSKSESLRPSQREQNMGLALESLETGYMLFSLGLRQGMEAQSCW